MPVYSLMVVRDPHGIRPAVVGSNDRGAHMAASESVALDALGTGLFGLKPADIGYIAKAHQAGRGEMDLNKIKVI